MANNPCSVFDFSASADLIQFEHLKEFLNNYAKKWCFQKEKGEETDYIHWQGRLSLKVRKRFSEMKEMNKGLKDNLHSIRWSVTSAENTKNDFYVMKEDTRKEGPWSDKDKVVYIPKQYRNIKLYKWQQEVIDSRNAFNDRVIDMIYDEKGNNGKSTVAAIAEIMYNAIDCPPINDCKELIQYVCNECMDNDIRTPGLLFVDLPRAMNKDGLYGIYSAIEQIKKGKLVDTRYHGRKWWIDSPRIWVFSNHLPDLSLLSNDRWRIWTINKDTQQLERFLGGKPVIISKKRML